MQSKLCKLEFILQSFHSAFHETPQCPKCSEVGVVCVILPQSDESGTCDCVVDFGGTRTSLQVAFTAMLPISNIIVRGTGRSHQNANSFETYVVGREHVRSKGGIPVPIQMDAGLCTFSSAFHVPSNQLEYSVKVDALHTSICCFGPV